MLSMFKNKFYYLLVLLLFSCNTIKDINSIPIEIEKSSSVLMSINKDDQNLIDFLKYYNFSIPKKGSHWNSDLIVMMGIYYNKSLALKRAEYGLIASDVQVLAAGYKNYLLTPLIEYHNEGKPFSLGLSIEMPTKKVSIKKIKTDLVRVKSITKALEITEPVWELRTSILKAIVNILKLEYEYSIEERIINKYSENYSILNDLYNQGFISQLLLNKEKIIIEELVSNLDIIKAKVKASRIYLASMMNVPMNMILDKKIIFANEKVPSLNDFESELNNKLNIALINRGEVLTSLSKYAETELELRLLIAEENKLVTSINPGILWDQTDLIFNLSGAILLSNKDLTDAKISKAYLKRDVMKASFEATQSLILSQVQSAYAKMLVVNAEYYAALSLLENANLSLLRVIDSKNSGQLSILNIKTAELLILQREKLISNTNFSRMTSLFEFEDSLGQSYFKGSYIPQNAYYPIDYFSHINEGILK